MTAELWANSEVRTSLLAHSSQLSGFPTTLNSIKIQIKFFPASHVETKYKLLQVCVHIFFVLHGVFSYRKQLNQKFMENSSLKTQ